MEIPRGGLLALMLHDEGGDSSQGSQERNSQGTSNLKREWKEATFMFWVDMCEEKYWEYNCKPFKQANWEFFARQLNTQFPNDPQRTW
jgi:hypothetical protein